MTVLATAGHVDHGKSTLVRALTGTDPDRFAEEKQRGLTIDLGFAAMTLPSGRRVSFVDVPGHVRFLKNMLAGAGAVSACVFVVAANEGWMPQTEEHLRILDLMGVDRGVVVLSKQGTVDDDRRTEARHEVAERLEGSPLARAELVGVDAVDGTGIGALRLALDRLASDAPGAVDRGRPRLWVDRSFAIRGAGTVVTGTLEGGALGVDDEVMTVPGGLVARIRTLQIHGSAVARTGPGERVAVNLAGISHEQVTRGDAVVLAGSWHRTRRFDATLEVLAALDHRVSRRGAYLAYIGSGEHVVTVRVLGRESLRPGEQGLVRVHLETEVPLLPGDRWVLRESGRGETVGGGEVLDVDPVLPASRARPDRSVERVIAERGWVDADVLALLTGTERRPTIGRWVIDPAVLAAERARLDLAVAGAGPLGLDLAGLDARERELVRGLGHVTIAQGRATVGTPGNPLADHPYLEALIETPFAPPPPTAVDRAELRELVRQGLVVEEGGIAFAPRAVDEAAEVIATLLADQPDGVTVGQIREALGTSRKFAIPLLVLLDRTGRTRRRGDRRIAGPRLLAHRTG